MTLIPTVVKHKQVVVVLDLQVKVPLMLPLLKVVIQHTKNMKNQNNVVVNEDVEERVEKVEKVKESRVENHANLVVKEESHVVVVEEEEEVVHTTRGKRTETDQMRVPLNKEMVVVVNQNHY